MKTFLAVFPDVDSACTAVSNVIDRGIVPAAMEIIDSVAIRAILNVMKGVFPSEAGSVLLVELEGSPEEVEELSSEVQATMYAAGAMQVMVALEPQERERLWAARKGAFGALGSLAPNYYLVDGVVPRTRLAETLAKVAEISNRYGLLVANVFHAGDGNLHPCIAFDEREAGAIQKVIEAGEEMLKVCVEMGGTLTGEHGVGLEKKVYMPLIFTEQDMDAMVRVRNAFSPTRPFQPRENISRWPRNTTRRLSERRCPALAPTPTSSEGSEKLNAPDGCPICAREHLPDDATVGSNVSLFIIRLDEFSQCYLTGLGLC